MIFYREDNSEIFSNRFVGKKWYNTIIFYYKNTGQVCVF